MLILIWAFVRYMPGAFAKSPCVRSFPLPVVSDQKACRMLHSCQLICICPVSPAVKLKECGTCSGPRANKLDKETRYLWKACDVATPVHSHLEGGRTCGKRRAENSCTVASCSLMLSCRSEAPTLGMGRGSCSIQKVPSATCPWAGARRDSRAGRQGGATGQPNR